VPAIYDDGSRRRAQGAVAPGTASRHHLKLDHASVTASDGLSPCETHHLLNAYSHSKKKPHSAVKSRR
jgi:hypothetical protein